ncbi:hypothetical protein RvY_11905 [Ramazzottius varieornatus]|uniref:Uncharacterized protein n=1 Tax=Ramazzottius varieornatus TaxID=947166 RepID=A0A1D1VLY9_RAMVA|nr:hypothetical protein RvY_11905 [Ramazzottius varieornatus]
MTNLILQSLRFPRVVNERRALRRLRLVNVSGGPTQAQPPHEWHGLLWPRCPPAPAISNHRPRTGVRSKTKFANSVLKSPTLFGTCFHVENNNRRSTLLGSTRAPSVTMLEDSTVDAPSSAPVIASSSKPAQVLVLPPADLYLPVVEPALLANLQNPCEYVDLENCLPQNRATFGEIEGPATSTGRGRGAGGSEKHRIRSFDDRAEALSLFSRFRGYYAPELASPMVGYINVIRKLSKQFPLATWQA